MAAAARVAPVMVEVVPLWSKTAARFCRPSAAVLDGQDRFGVAVQVQPSPRPSQRVTRKSAFLQECIHTRRDQLSYHVSECTNQRTSPNLHTHVMCPRNEFSLAICVRCFAPSEQRKRLRLQKRSEAFAYRAAAAFRTHSAPMTLHCTACTHTPLILSTLAQSTLPTVTPRPPRSAMPCPFAELHTTDLPASNDAHRGRWSGPRVAYCSLAPVLPAQRTEPGRPAPCSRRIRGCVGLLLSLTGQSITT